MKLNKPVFMISRQADLLAEALKKSPRLITVWVRTGKFKDKYPLIRTAVAFDAKSNTEAKEYVKNFVSLIPVPKTHTRLTILKGISVSCVRQLLAYTKRDLLIRAQTHDFDRFKSKKSYSAWKKRGKIVYSLIDRKGRLSGIIWFGRKPFKNYKFTFAIRTYPPVRGKGVSKKFMSFATKDFLKKHKHPGFWLKTLKDNVRAIRLYKRFGFKVESEDKKNNEVVMTFKP